MCVHVDMGIGMGVDVGVGVGACTIGSRCTSLYLVGVGVPHNCGCTS